jgi:hypothetical protein
MANVFAWIIAIMSILNLAPAVIFISGRPRPRQRPGIEMAPQNVMRHYGWTLLALSVGGLVVAAGLGRSSSHELNALLWVGLVVVLASTTDLARHPIQGRPYGAERV